MSCRLSAVIVIYDKGANESKPWKSASSKKLRLDFVPVPGLGRAMDTETSEIIALLCARIGMIMEDASVVALTINGLDEYKRSTAIEELEAAGDRIRALAAAARALSA